MRGAMRLWFFLGRPQYSDFDALKSVDNIDVVYYSRQGRDFTRGINVTQNFHKASRAERHAYRFRLREGAVPLDESTGKMVGRRENSI